MAPKRKLAGEKVDPSTSRRRRQLMDDLVRETDEEFNQLMDEHGEIPPSRWPHHGIEITPEEEAALGIPGEQYVEEEDNAFYTTSDSHSRSHDQRPLEDDVHIWPEGFEYSMQEKRAERITDDNELKDATNVDKLLHKENVFGRNLSPSLEK